MPPALISHDVKVFEFVRRITVDEASCQIVAQQFTDKLAGRFYPGSWVAPENVIKGFLLPGGNAKTHHIIPRRTGFRGFCLGCAFCLSWFGRFSHVY